MALKWLDKNLASVFKAHMFANNVKPHVLELTRRMDFEITWKLRNSGG